MDFALAPALRARLLGTGLVAIGVVVALGVLRHLARRPARPRSSPAWSCSPLVGVVALGLLLGVRHWVLRLDEHGYRVRVLRTAEARSARWTDVLDLQAGTVAGSRCVVLRLRDGRTTALPVDAIEGGSTAPHRGAHRPPRPGPRLPPAALSRAVGAAPRQPDFPGTSGMGNLWPAVLEVSPSPVYGARLLSGLRVIPSRGFKSRHLRRLTAPDPRGSGAVPVMP